MIHRKSRNTHITLLVGAALVAAVWLGIQAGPPEPPVPPGVSTMHPIDEVDPRTPIYPDQLPLTITESGSYYLASDIVTPGDGIRIVAQDVTLDLMGFTLAGGNGIAIDAVGMEGFTVRNGTILGWSDSGLRLGNRSVAERVIVRYCSGSGIVGGVDSLVTDCIASSNGMHGIVVNTGSLVRGCMSSNNNQNGIWVEVVSALTGALVTGCVVDGNARNGIRVDGSAAVLGNFCRGNDQSGYLLKAGIWINGDHNRIDGNHVIDNGIGIDVAGDFNVITRNTLRGNTLQDWRISGSATGNLLLNWTVASSDPPGAWDNIEL